tara:strand:+ start:327 stop:509 length:183 start_codon:yes stop_codon:yes gene_type:complete
VNDKLKRRILLCVYKALKVEINFKEKCDKCFEKRVWNTAQDGFLCEEHNRELINKIRRKK